jgi:hypothetical protein
VTKFVGCGNCPFLQNVGERVLRLAVGPSGTQWLQGPANNRLWRPLLRVTSVAAGAAGPFLRSSGFVRVCVAPVHVGTYTSK